MIYIYIYIDNPPPSSDTLASLERVYHGGGVDGVLKRDADTIESALTTDRQIIYSLWYEGCGAFAHAMNDTTLPSSFIR